MRLNYDISVAPLELITSQYEHRAFTTRSGVCHRVFGLLLMFLSERGLLVLPLGNAAAPQGVFGLLSCFPCEVILCFGFVQ